MIFGSRAFFKRLAQEPFLGRTLRVFALGTALWILDPVGVATNSEIASIAFFYRVVAPSYPGLEARPHSNEPDDQPVPIAVIVINDESIERIMISEAGGEVCVTRRYEEEEGVFCPEPALGRASGAASEIGETEDATWPPSLAIHAAVLRKVLKSAEPAAFFVDFGFFDRRGAREIDYLRDVICRYAALPAEAKSLGRYRSDERDEACAHVKREEVESGTRIFLSGLGPDAPRGLEVIPELAAAATGLVSTRYIGEDPGSYNRYLRYDCLAGLRSPAMAMYAAGMARHVLTDEVCGGDANEASFSVFWATWGDADRSRGAFPCRSLHETAVLRAAQELAPWLVRVIEPLLGDRPVSNAAVLQDCPPHLSIAAHRLLSDNQGIEVLLEGWYVFYGGNFTMAGDLVRPPTHKPIPGVFLHAMALDNLVQGVRADTNEGLGNALMILTLLIGALSDCLLTNGLSVIEEARDADPNRRSFRLYLSEGLWFLICGAIFIFSLLALLTVAFRYTAAPINYIGAILIIAVSQFNEILRRLIGPFSRVALRVGRTIKNLRLK